MTDSPQPISLTAHLRALKGVAHKLDIQPVRDLLPRDLTTVAIGDDCAALPDGSGGHLLFAIEGLLDEFVSAEPWFAGYCAVMVNVSDIYAMGGRPIALVDALWTAGVDRAGPIWSGMSAAAEKYGVPIVGGHTNSRAATDHLAAAILGKAGPRLLTSFDAKPGDVFVVVFDLRGEWFGPYPYWNASTTAPGDRLRGDLSLLADLADQGYCSAGKDISMGGLVGTATMLAECSNVGLTIDVQSIPKPTGVATEKWLSAFPSFGFILAVRPDRVAEVCKRFEERQLSISAAGTFDDSRVVRLTEPSGETEVYWDLRESPFINFGPAQASSSRGSRGER